jgi:hypothetical protein
MLQMGTFIIITRQLCLRIGKNDKSMWQKSKMLHTSFCIKLYKVSSISNMLELKKVKAEISSSSGENNYEITWLKIKYAW